ncbi:hypothetical protein BVRB_021900, partial [Beta vulgaris subsp. vulgaris]
MRKRHRTKVRAYHGCQISRMRTLLITCIPRSETCCCSKKLICVFTKAEYFQQLQRIVNDQFSIETVDVLDLDWPVKLKEIQLIYGAHIVGECQDLLAYHTTLGFVAHNVAELQDWAANRFQLEPPEGQQRPDYQRLARESLRTFCKSRAKVCETFFHPCLDFSSSQSPESNFFWGFRLFSWNLSRLFDQS